MEFGDHYTVLKFIPKVSWMVNPRPGSEPEAFKEGKGPDLMDPLNRHRNEALVGK